MDARDCTTPDSAVCQLPGSGGKSSSATTRIERGRPRLEPDPQRSLMSDEHEPDDEQPDEPDGWEQIGTIDVRPLGHGDLTT